MDSSNDNVIICENCYEENEPTRKICKNCGAKLYRNRNMKSNEDKYNEYEYKSNIEKEMFEAETTYVEDNKIAVILRVVAIIEIIGGFILGVILGNTYEIVYDFNWGLFVGTVIAGFISGIFILGFAEVIQLLQDIKDRKE